MATLLVVALALAAWQLSFVLLLGFGGLLLAVLLRRAAVIVARHTPLPTGAALAVVILGLAGVAALFGLLIGTRIMTQVEELLRSLPEAVAQIEAALRARSWGNFLLEAMPSAEDRPAWNVMGALGGTVSTAVGVVGNLVVVLTVAVFLAVDPGLYRRGLLHLVPQDRRGRAGEVLDSTGEALWRWLMGQLVAMSVVALLTGAGLWLLGIPFALTLGLSAGILDFIPYIGPILAAIPAVLVALTQSPVDAAYTVLLFVVIQQVEGNILMPLIQKRATDLPPVLTILSVVGFGVLFGLLGVLFATPLLVVLVVVVRMLYVEDVLGDHTAAPDRG